MSETYEDLALAAEFPAASREAWLKLVEGVLRGASFEKKLVAKTYDGLPIEPLYGRAPDARPVAGRAPTRPWTILQRVDHPDPAAANLEALHDLENGATGLSLAFAGSIGAHGYGLAPTDTAIAQSLDKVYLDAVTIDFDIGPHSKQTPLDFAALVARSGIAAADIDARFGFDPIGAMALHGRSPRDWPAIQRLLAELVDQLGRQGFRGPFAVADGRLVHNAGGSEAQELAYVLALALAYLRALEPMGLDAARRAIFFRLAADADQLLTIAKLRSLRRLWARIEEACGLAPAPAVVAAETAWRMMTQRDPYVNMLRNTVATFAAGLGGADSITVLPHTLAVGLPDRFARRIARNTQLILLEEANLARVADPASGSGGIEDLTDKLCLAAWSEFQTIERSGGIWNALADGTLQRKIAAVRAARASAIARRREALTGTTEFPDIAEAPAKVLDVKPVALEALPDTVRLEALPQGRLAEPFEALRDASDRVLAATGARPKVFLANLGAIAAFAARAMFAKNFFEAGGVEAVTNDGFAGHDAVAAAFRASGARLACLCSSDEVYAEQAVAAARALSGATHLYLAGRPGEREAAYRAAGVGTFIYVGCDMLATLQAAHALLAIDRPALL